MLGSFRVESNSEETKSVRVKEFHTNLWIWNQKEMVLDIGIWCEIGQTPFFSSNPKKLKIHIPFDIENLTDLHEVISEQKILNLLLNESYEDYSINPGAQNGKSIRVVKFENEPRGRFMIYNSNPQIINSSTVGIILEGDKVDRGQLTHKKFLLDENSNEEKIDVYFRFRCKLKNKTKENIRIKKTWYKERIIYDLRVNDTRNNPEEKISSPLPIDKFMFFLILPEFYEISTETTQSKKYARALENGWESYIKNVKNKSFMVHYWKKENLGVESYNLLIKSKRDRQFGSTLEFFKVSIAIAACILFLIYQFSNTIYWVIEWLNYYLLIIIPAVFGFIYSLVSGNALWDFLKSLLGFSAKKLFGGIVKRKEGEEP